MSPKFYDQLQGDIRTHLRSVGESGSVAGGHLKPGDGLEIHHLQHLLGLSVNLNDIILMKRQVLDIEKYFCIEK